MQSYIKYKKGKKKQVRRLSNLLFIYISWQRSQSAREQYGFTSLDSSGDFETFDQQQIGLPSQVPNKPVQVILRGEELS